MEYSVNLKNQQSAKKEQDFVFIPSNNDIYRYKQEKNK